MHTHTHTHPPTHTHTHAHTDTQNRQTQANLQTDRKKTIDRKLDKKDRKTNKDIKLRDTEKWKDICIDSQMNKLKRGIQTDKHADRKTHKQTDIHVDRMTDH